MKKLLALFLCLSFLFLLAAPASASPIIMEGDYVKTAVSDNGTLGWGSTTSPGIIHDPTGSGDFSGHDYLTPGNPWEVFAVESAQTGNRVNNNNAPSGGAIATVSLTDLSVSSSYDHFITWQGTYATYFNITTDYFYNDGDERISMSTTITAARDLTSVSFLRAIDPDPDNYPGGTAATINGRGFDANNDGDFLDAGDIAPEDWVHSEGSISGLTLGLYSNSATTHNTGVSSGWSSDPNYYLAGPMDGAFNDYTIGVAFDIGTLLSGESITLDYAYIMGGSLETVDIPAVPEPATMLLLGSGLLGFAGIRRKKLIK